MASGDPVVLFLDTMPPDADVATLDLRIGGSTPGEAVIVRDFDATAIEYIDYKVQLVGYDGGGLTFQFKWSASAAVTGVTQWEAALRAMPDDAEDIDVSHTYLFNSVSATAPSVSGEVGYDTITFTDGVDMDTWLDGEVAILRVRRNTAAPDDMSGDAELWAVTGIET